MKIYSIRKKYMDLKISMKIMLVYLLFLAFSIAFSSFIYQRIYYDITSRKVSEVSIQTLYSIKSNINSVIDSINHNTRMVMSNKEIRTLLMDPTSGSDVDDQHTINNYLTYMIDAMNNVSSIYLFDNFGYKYGIDDQSIKNFNFKSINQANWYSDVLSKKGSYILRINAGFAPGQELRENYISFIRVINDTESLKNIGVLMANISENYFINCYKDIVSNNGTNIAILDENNRSIVKQNGISNQNLIDEQLRLLGSHEYNSVLRRENGQDFIISCLRIEKYDWKIIIKIPFRELLKESNIFSLVALLVILLNGFLLFIGSIFVSRLITNPIKKLLKSMKGIENGEFKRVEIMAGNDEIGRLRDGYNIMVSEIENLIKRVIDEQKIKRKAELNVLQAQIKPHFLYNMLETMGYLALSGQSEKVYFAIEAMGGYYRKSLSKGSEVITIRDEVDIVKNYLTLQKLRYEDVFEDTYEVDEQVCDRKILKLVLQPLVENALYHGIKPMGEKGHIHISVYRLNDFIHISVEDDGVGMDEEELANVLNTGLEKNSSSFGLRGTMERLRIFYGVTDVYRIESRKYQGTKVTIIIPEEKAGQND